jgi:hypothetical protein
LEEFAPGIVFFKGIYNTVADAIFHLDSNTTVNPTNEYNHAMLSTSAIGETITKWKTFSNYDIVTMNTTLEHKQGSNLSQVFANHSKEEEIFTRDS